MVARLDVVGVRQHDAAFQARAHFGYIVLETAQRGDGRRRDDDVLAREARVEPLADDAFEHQQRSEEHTSELQSLMRISYAVFCLKKKRECTKSTKIQQSN